MSTCVRSVFPSRRQRVVGLTSQHVRSVAAFEGVSTMSLLFEHAVEAFDRDSASLVAASDAALATAGEETPFVPSPGSPPTTTRWPIPGKTGPVSRSTEPTARRRPASTSPTPTTNSAARSSSWRATATTRRSRPRSSAERRWPAGVRRADRRPRTATEPRRGRGPVRRVRRLRPGRTRRLSRGNRRPRSRRRQAGLWLF
jgi:hypothetical protein